jgi:integrase
VNRKRAEGLLYEKVPCNLTAFSQHVGNLSLNRVETAHIAAFLDCRELSVVTWRVKYHLLKHFFEFWASRGEMPMVRMPALRPLVRGRAFIPHIYSRQEIQALLNAIRSNPRHLNRVIDPQTMSTLILFLYGTGALVGEALRLKPRDVDLKAGFITIQSNRFNRTRRIPIGADMKDALLRYQRWKVRKKLTGTHFLLTKDGRPLITRTVNKRFQRIRTTAGVARHDGAKYQPRMHDLRSTFAVHRISSWIKHGANLNRMLPALAVYLGQVGLASTERFLSLTPEYFRKPLEILSPKRTKKHWRDSPALMRRLAEL